MQSGGQRLHWSSYSPRETAVAMIIIDQLLKYIYVYVDKYQNDIYAIAFSTFIQDVRVITNLYRRVQRWWEREARVRDWETTCRKKRQDLKDWETTCQEEARFRKGNQHLNSYMGNEYSWAWGWYINEKNRKSHLYLLWVFSFDLVPTEACSLVSREWLHSTWSSFFNLWNVRQFC